jgi:nicotinamide mononucleotide (NMN) deamidase PncC
MKDLVPIAQQIAARLTERRQTIAVAESSTGGLISAALLAVPGASVYFLGGAVVYTREARRLLMDIPDAAMKGIRSASESLCATAGKPDPSALFSRLGVVRNRRDRADGQSLRRRGGP